MQRESSCHTSEPGPDAPPRRQVSELTLLGCYRAARGLAQLTNLTMLDLQPVEEEADGDGAHDLHV